MYVGTSYRFSEDPIKADLKLGLRSLGIVGGDKDKDEDGEDAYDNNDEDKMIELACGGDGKGEINGSGSYDQVAGKTIKLTALRTHGFV
ncbi:hypothetical protein ACHAPG_008715 [Botrytis cinerea]